jgi:hypothetical protein
MKGECRVATMKQAQRGGICSASEKHAMHIDRFHGSIAAYNLRAKLLICQVVDQNCMSTHTYTSSAITYL